MPQTIQAAVASLRGTTHHLALTATTYTEPIRAVWNNGAAGTFSFRGPDDSAAVDMYLAQYEKVAMVQIIEITAIGAGMDLVGGY